MPKRFSLPRGSGCTKGVNEDSCQYRRFSIRAANWMQKGGKQTTRKAGSKSDVLLFGSEKPRNKRMCTVLGQIGNKHGGFVVKLNGESEEESSNLGGCLQEKPAN